MDQRYLQQRLLGRSFLSIKGYSTMTATYSGPGTYIAVCNASDFKSHYLRLFTIPDEEQWRDTEAGWYFMNRVNFVACLEMVLPFSALIGPTLFLPAAPCTCESTDVVIGMERAEEGDDSSIYFWMQCGDCDREVDGYTLEGCFAKWRGLPVPKAEEEAKAAFRAKWEAEAAKLEDEHTHLTGDDDDDDEEEWNGDE